MHGVSLVLTIAFLSAAAFGGVLWPPSWEAAWTFFWPATKELIDFGVYNYDYALHSLKITNVFCDFNRNVSCDIFFNGNNLRVYFPEEAYCCLAYPIPMTPPNLFENATLAGVSSYANHKMSFSSRKSSGSILV